MTRTNEDWWAPFAICMFLLGVLLGVVLTETLVKAEFRDELIKRDLGEYDGRTGKFKWKENK